MCPRASRMCLISLPFLALRKRLPSSALATDEATNLSAVHKAWMAPSRKIGLVSKVLFPRKQWPPAVLLALGSLRHEASECIWRITSDGQCLILALGCVAQ